ncbi:2527_t:CDS:10 [Diversispora eburnea]|uniref:2527_t:CDS:1 n=1 Tax=Diversispora eburnea TaxID=1213867 RepID=A0A9N8VSK8_9GLOM|nr:2527_t:CDS:10 [Diversispora eburnea]
MMLRSKNLSTFFGIKKIEIKNVIGFLDTNVQNVRYYSHTPKPLEGIRVLELGQLIAGPFCGTILGYYGAEVIKIEPPEMGDPIRIWRKIDIDGIGPWFRSIGRNKKSCEINLRTEEGIKLARQLADKSDVLIENFRPGVMEKWGLGPDELYKTNPSLIYTRVSGFGQTGPYAKKPGFASVCEAMAGYRYINGFPGQPPVRQNISMGDSIAGLTAAFGTVMGLLARNKLASNAISGQVIDVAIYESIFNMMEGILPEYDRFGEIRQPSGTSVTGIVPTNAYPCSDSKNVIIGGNSDTIYKRLMKVIGREDLATEQYATNKERVQHKDLIDNAISDWSRKHTSKEVIEKLEKDNIPCGPIYNIQDIVEDEHVQSRGILETVRVNENKENGGWDLKIPAITPKLSATPGETIWAGPDLGQHNREILMDILGLEEKEIKKLQDNKIIGKTL